MAVRQRIYYARRLVIPRPWRELHLQSSGRVFQKPVGVVRRMIFGAGSGEGDSCRADQLYDPTVPLFRDVFKQRPDFFPSEDFASPEWLEVSAFSALSLMLPLPLLHKYHMQVARLFTGVIMTRYCLGHGGC